MKIYSATTAPGAISLPPTPAASLCRKSPLLTQRTREGWGTTFVGDSGEIKLGAQLANFVSQYFSIMDGLRK